MSTRVWIGTYTSGAHPGVPSPTYRPDYTPVPSKSEGIYTLTFDPADGKLAQVELASPVPCENPSYLCVHPNGKFLYAVNEVDDYEGGSGSISAYAIAHTTHASESPKLIFMNKVSARGAISCHVSTDPKGETLFVANYMGPTVAAYPLQDNGEIADKPSAVVGFEGKGPNEFRQGGPHPHCVTLCPLTHRYAFVADLGGDAIHVFEFDAKNKENSLKFLRKVQVAPGSGPRQLSWHPSGKFAYVINELNSTICVFTYDGAGGLEQVQVADCSPPGYDSRPYTKWSSEVQVHPGGKFLYAMNRIVDSFAVFSVADDGRLTVVGHTPTNGKTPRNFAIDHTGSHLLVCNQHSDNVTSFKINVHSVGGDHLTQLHEVYVPMPAYALFM